MNLHNVVVLTSTTSKSTALYVDEKLVASFTLLTAQLLTPFLSHEPFVLYEYTVDLDKYYNETERNSFPIELDEIIDFVV